MTNKIYDRAKWTFTVVLPALGAFYAAVAPYWGWGYVEAVVGTVAALAALGGTILGVSSIQYAKKQ